jgi:[ribosomal protein S5]-alanine N-acetyltransferase
MTSVELRTPRLLLRELSMADLDAVHGYASDPEVTRYMSWGPNALDDTRSFLQFATSAANANPRVVYELGITESATGRLVGACGLHASDDGQAMLGYCLHREVWGMGYGTEAATAQLRFAFEQLRLHRVWAGTDPGNTGSARILEKLGMTLEGHLRENARVRSEWRDTIVFAILDHEWTQLNSRSV